MKLSVPILTFIIGCLSAEPATFSALAADPTYFPTTDIPTNTPTYIPTFQPTPSPTRSPSAQPTTSKAAKAKSVKA
eukprot:CCRYP_002159-RA/>CCRYP_002159-RA protein AED:0.38 eAED:0.38 QI:0/-1/0/1/-1/1/1/0/75